MTSTPGQVRKNFFDKFAKVSTKPHYNTRLLAKECFFVKFRSPVKKKKREKVFN